MHHAKVYYQKILIAIPSPSAFSGKSPEQSIASICLYFCALDFNWKWRSRKLACSKWHIAQLAITGVPRDVTKSVWKRHVSRDQNSKMWIWTNWNKRSKWFAEIYHHIQFWSREAYLLHIIYVTNRGIRCIRGNVFMPVVKM